MSHDAEPDTRFEVRITSDSHFAWIRTRMALERTLMAWVRTSTALIGFGFTIVQFFRSIAEAAGVEPARHPEAARYLGLALISAGILALLVAIYQYRAMIRYLWSENFKAIAGPKRDPVTTPLVAVAVGVTLIGIFALLAVALRFV